MLTPLLLLVLVAASRPTSALRITIDNLSPRTDANGQIIDAHDGNIVQWQPDGDYYYYAMEYGLCRETGVHCDVCGSTHNNS